MEIIGKVSFGETSIQTITIPSADVRLAENWCDEAITVLFTKSDKQTNLMCVHSILLKTNDIFYKKKEGVFSDTILKSKHQHS